jgi:hypothetical protein
MSISMLSSSVFVEPAKEAVLAGDRDLGIPGCLENIRTAPQVALLIDQYQAIRKLKARRPQYAHRMLADDT